MLERTAILACLANPARLWLPGAQKELAEPESEALLPDSTRAVKEKASGQLSGRSALRQQGAKLIVTVKVY
jgi:hypothetical protein